MISNEVAVYILFAGLGLATIGMIFGIFFAIINKNTVAKICMAMAAVGAILVGGIVFIMQGQQEKKENNAESQTLAETEQTVDLSVTYDDIYNAYMENELVANDLYRYNRYRITAKINGMSTDGLFNLTGGATLTMERRVGNTIVFFYAEFEKEQEEALKKVKVGDTITFEGECVGKSGFDECELVPER